MCGRYAMDVSPDQLPEYFAQSNLAVDRVRDAPEETSNTYNIGPTRTAAEYHYEKNGDILVHIVQYLKWGLIPHWTKTNDDMQPWKRFNARVESLNSNTPLWVSSKNKKRCVVPLQGYFEWIHKPVPGTKKVDKIPYYVKRKDDKLMFLAGLRDTCRLENSDEIIHSYTIITGPAPEQLRWLHPRMPIVLVPGTKEFDTWLDPDIDEWSKELLSSLNPYEKSDLECYRVSQKVNKFTSSGPDLIEPFKDKQTGITSFFTKSSNQSQKNKHDSGNQTKLLEDSKVKVELKNSNQAKPKVKKEAPDTESTKRGHSEETHTKEQDFKKQKKS